jgi:LPS-assembly lipoprotein
MSSFNRRTLLTLPLALPAVLAACGFTPAYGPAGPAQGLQGRIRAADPGDKNGFDFVTAIEARFGRSKDPRYGLAYTITTEAVGVGFVATDTTITRYNLTGRVDWSLTDTESDTRIAGGTAENFTSWSATSATVAAVAAEQDAAKRLMVILADQITAEILAASVRFTP